MSANVKEITKTLSVADAGDRGVLLVIAVDGGGGFMLEPDEAVRVGLALMETGLIKGGKAK